MQITESRSSKKFPKKNMSMQEKLEFIAQGRITVGRFHRVTDTSIVDFYLPRIRGRNFRGNDHSYKHPGYQTADQAFCQGHVLQEKIRRRAEQKEN